MSKYAKNTSVPVSRTIDAIDKEVSRFGAESFGTFRNGGKVVCMFQVDGVTYRYETSDSDDEKEQRRLWRCILATIKGKLIAVSEGISTFEEEFVSNIVMPDGKLLKEHLLPQLQKAINSGSMNVKLLPG